MILTWLDVGVTKLVLSLVFLVGTTFDDSYLIAFFTRSLVNVITITIFIRILLYWYFISHHENMELLNFCFFYTKFEPSTGSTNLKKRKEITLAVHWQK